MDVITKTRRRFMFLMTIVTALIIGAALIAVYGLTYSSQEANNRQRLNSFEEVRVTGNGTVSFDGQSANAYVVERTLADIGTNFTMLVNNQGQIIYTLDSEESQTQKQLQNAADIAWLGENYDKVELEGRVWQYCVSPAVASITVDDDQQLEKSDEIYQIRFIDITESRNTIKTLAITLSVIGILLLIFFFFFSMFFSKRAIHPLIDVMEKQQQFIADASHELKTPLSIIKANCSVLSANEEETIASQREWLYNIMTGADRMTNLIHNLIALAKIEGANNDMLKSETDLGKELDESLDMLDVIIKEKSLLIESNHRAAIIWSDPVRVQQVINIVLDNAIKYSNVGGSIRIDMTSDKKWLYLSVSNTGNGIARDDLQKIFNRFYRVEGARTQDGSHGLGLSIAQMVMKQLGGSIKAESIMGEGATFTLRFPIK